MGVLTLKAATYRAIADDKTATGQAAIVFVIFSLIANFFGNLVKTDPQGNILPVNVGGAVVGAIVGVIFGLIGWVVGAWILAFVAKMLGGKTDTNEMLRVTGFVEAFSIVAVLTVLALITPALACVAALILFVVAILRLIGFVIGVREAAEFSTGNAIITAIVAAIVRFIIEVVILGAVLGAILVAVGVAGAR
jgi:hypothetical protein